MTACIMVQPSSFMPSGIRMSQVGDVYLFKFTDDLQDRLEVLLDENKEDALTPAERAELDGISELLRIFTFINAQLVAQAKACPSELEDLYDAIPLWGGQANALNPTVPNVSEVARPLLWEERDKIKQNLRARFANVSENRSLVDELIAERRQAAKREATE